MAQKTLRRFGDRVRWDLLPVWVLLAGLVAWLGILTMIVLAEAGVPDATINRISTVSGILAAVVVLQPILGPAIEVVIDRWRS